MDEEIYDDTIAPAVQPSGLSALKSRFEKPAPAGNKPALGSKPTFSPKSASIAAKFGGANNNNTEDTKPLGNATPDRGKTSVVADKSDSGSMDGSDAKDKPFLGKRNSKVNIPAAFQKAEAPPPLDQKPKPAVKPVTPKWKPKQDDSNNNKNTETNSNVLKSPRDNSTTMIDKDSSNSKPIGLQKKPMATPSQTGNVKERANMLFGGGVSPAVLKSALKPVSPRSTENSGTSQNKFSAKRVGVDVGGSGGGPVEFRNKFGAQIKTKRKSVKSIVRSKDSRKFHKIDAEDIKSEVVTPSKPSKLDVEIDWEQLATDYGKTITDIESSQIEEYDEEEEYDDIANVMQKPANRAVSIIQPLTEEEEKEWEEAGFEGALTDSNESLPPPPPGKIIPNKNKKDEKKELMDPPQEEYDDVGILMQNGSTDYGEELYEPLPDEPPDITPPPLSPKSGVVQNGTGKPPPPPPTEQIDKKDQKESEKDRKKREKEEKEREKKKEKEFRKKQEDLKHMMSKFKIDAQGLMQSVGKGTIRKSAKGTKKDLAVQHGDKVDIIRMVDNDKGKWLVRIINTDKVGYVESTNVEVDTSMIRDVMEGSTAKQTFSSSSSISVSEGDDDGETYEAVEGEDFPDPIEEEIYEECN